MPFGNLSNNSPRFQISIRIVAIFFLIGILMSTHLWIKDRSFPTAPVHPIPGQLPDLFTLCLSIALVVGLLITTVTINRKILIAEIAIIAMLCLLDQNRMQPWVYFYFLFLLVSVFGLTSGISLSLNMLRLLLIAVYLWSGIQKFNEGFVNVVFHDLLQSWVPVKNKEELDKLIPAGYLIPVIEVLIGVGLFFGQTRKWALTGAVVSHVIVIIFLFTKNNSIIIPWNVAMLMLVFTLFFGTHESVNIFKREWRIQNVVSLIVSLLIFIVPVFNKIGWWDDYLSFKLYSENTKELFIVVSDEQLPALKHQFDAYFIALPKGVEGGALISANKWAMSELNVPCYPEERVFKRVCREFCDLNLPNEDLYFLIFKKPVYKNDFKAFTCMDIH